MNTIYSKSWKGPFCRFALASQRTRTQGGRFSALCTRAAAGVVGLVASMGVAPAFAADAKAMDSRMVGISMLLTGSPAIAQHLFDATGATDGSADAAAGGVDSVAAGANAYASGEGSTAVGAGSGAFEDRGSAFGASSVANEVESTAMGAGSVAYDKNSTAVGAFALAQGEGSSAFGGGAGTNAAYATAVGYNAFAGGANSIALGAHAIANGANSVALGPNASAGANGVALGANAYAEDNTVSVGSVGSERRITHVAEAVNQTDAVNKQLLDDAFQQISDQVVAYDPGTNKGGITLEGASGTRITNLTDGTVSADSSDAVTGRQLYGTNQQVGALNTRVTNLEVASGDVTALTQGQAGMFQVSSADVVAPVASGIHATAGGAGSVASGTNSTALGNGARATAANTVASGDAAVASALNSTALGSNAQATVNNSVAIGANSLADRANTVSVGAVGQERQVANVAAGTQSTDAANVGQVQEALVTAKRYADVGDQSTLSSAKAYTDSKLTDVNRQITSVSNRLDRVGAMGTAMAGMAGAIAAAPNNPNRVSAAVGGYRSQAALAVGYARALPSTNGAILFGGSVASSGEASGSVGVSFGW